MKKKEYQNYPVQIIGFADPHGSSSSLLPLTLARAQSVQTALMSRGVDSKRVMATGQGGAEPIASGKDRNKNIASRLSSFTSRGMTGAGPDSPGTLRGRLTREAVCPVSGSPPPLQLVSVGVTVVSVMPTILLFDVDGTLVTTDGVGRRAIEKAFERRHGRADVVSFSFAGMTDKAIVRDGLLAWQALRF